MPAHPRWGRGRRTSPAAGIPNRTEMRYSQHLEQLRLAGDILAWRFECIRLRLGLDDKTTYTPDFEVLLPSMEYEYHEVKGAKNYRQEGQVVRAGAYWPEDSRLKVKVAAAIYPERCFVGVRERKPVDGPGGPWIREEFSRPEQEPEGARPELPFPATAGAPGGAAGEQATSSSRSSTRRTRT